jgi:replicative DNA helicase
MTEVKFKYDADFQTKILACLLKLTEFNVSTFGIIKPEYFENDAEAIVAKQIIDHFGIYQVKPDATTLVNLIKTGIAKKTIPPKMTAEISAAYRNAYNFDTSNSEYITSEVGKFARYCAMSDAILKSVDLIERGDFDTVDSLITKASQVGLLHNTMSDYDFFGEDEIKARMVLKDERSAGVLLKKTVKTGIKKLDLLLYHKGWGKGEMVVFMGLPKAGKSISLAFFAKNAALAGHNVLFITLEVSKDITSERIESSMSEIKMNDLSHHSTAVAEKITELRASSGRLMIEERPTGTMTPKDLEEIVAFYRNQRGIEFDMIALDYADIMRPNRHNDNAIENSKSVYVDLRAIAQKENVALLTATQANREGIKGGILKMENVAEDFNKIRIADLVISINRTPEEVVTNTARLYFAASRNQMGDKTLKISQDLSTMTFIKALIGIE